ncbi:DUF4105 domain-containing protein [Methylobacterium sp. NEAU 140]|uniref:lipoprotein N-acyltransferase Lnb domain-containing protein n=1 Tax=Methylobacterium sp. NEAU 140 TaxID=3064945 RepID=UPI0027330FA5|nr:DUF4105 domain-containing protein [Methylobacterium sp. NEAU 140]MDP4025271.1 DUF4105 domain-containing protein [Methylobacterium sp. NEAU 140]
MSEPLPPRPPRPYGDPRTASLWLLLVGRAEVRRHWHLLVAAGAVSAALGVLVLIDSLDGALHVPDRWFGLLLLIEGVGTLVVGMTALGTARRLRILKGLVLTVMAVLIVASTRHSAFLLAMIFGTAFLVDGAVRIVIASLLKFSGWRISVALGALGVAFGLFHLQPWPTWYAGTVGYCIGMFLILNGARFALAGVVARRMAPDPSSSSAPAASGPDALTVRVWTPTGRATTPARQRLVRRYVASVDTRGVFSTGHAALEHGDDLYLSHYPAVEIDRSPANLRASLRAGPENDVPGRFLPSYAAEAADWCEATVSVRLTGIDAARLRTFWAAYSRDTTYNFISRNCSTTVASALDAAVEGAFARTGHPWRRLARALTTPEFWAAALLRNGAAAMTWTPGLVLDYSRALSVLLDPVSPVPGIAWKGVGRRFVRNWRAGSLAEMYRIARRRPAPRAEPTEA